MSIKANAQTPKRTLEEVETISRARAKAWYAQHPMMSDDEFERSYDPQGYRDRLLLEALRDLANAIWRLAPDSLMQREQPWRPSQAARTIHPPTGAIEL
jgi:hypothetical protein